MYHQFILFRCHAPDQTLNGWTPVLVVFSDIEQIPLAEAALRYIARRLESWQVGRDPRGITGKDFLALEIAAVRNHIKRIGPDRLFGLS
jgi:hypothetical protein